MLFVLTHAIFSLCAFVNSLLFNGFLLWRGVKREHDSLCFPAFLLLLNACSSLIREAYLAASALYSNFCLLLARLSSVLYSPPVWSGLFRAAHANKRRSPTADRSLHWRPRTPIFLCLIQALEHRNKNALCSLEMMRRGWPLRPAEKRLSPKPLIWD